MQGPERRSGPGRSLPNPEEREKGRTKHRYPLMRRVTLPPLLSLFDSYNALYRYVSVLAYPFYGRELDRLSLSKLRHSPRRDYARVHEVDELCAFFLEGSK